MALVWSQDNAADSEYQYIKLDHSYGDGSVAVYYKNAEEGKSEARLLGCGGRTQRGKWPHRVRRLPAVVRTTNEDVDLLVAGLRVSFN